MFNKQASWENEILQEMEKSLVKNAADMENEPLKKYASAIDSLNEAAETFDALGMAKEAELTTRLIEVVAGKKKPKKKVDKKPSKSKSKANSKTSVNDSKSSKSDPATKGLTSEKEVENLKTKGWVFNADDVEIFNADDVNDYRPLTDLELHRQDKPADYKHYENMANELDREAMNAAHEGRAGVAKKLFELSEEYRHQAEEMRRKENHKYFRDDFDADDLNWVFDDEEWSKDEREMDLAGAGMDLEDQERDIAEDLGDDNFDMPSFEPMGHRKHRW